MADQYGSTVNETIATPDEQHIADDTGKSLCRVRWYGRTRDRDAEEGRLLPLEPVSYTWCRSLRGTWRYGVGPHQWISPHHGSDDFAGRHVDLLSMADLNRVLLSHEERPLLIAAAAFFPVGVVHGIGVWLGGW